FDLLRPSDLAGVEPVRAGAIAQGSGRLGPSLPASQGSLPVELPQDPSLAGGTQFLYRFPVPPFGICRGTHLHQPSVPVSQSGSAGDCRFCRGEQFVPVLLSWEHSDQSRPSEVHSGYAAVAPRPPLTGNTSQGRELCGDLQFLGPPLRN